MKIRNLIGSAISAVALTAGAAHASDFNGPFYQCVETDTVVFDGSIVDAAVATPELSTLVTAVTAAGLVEALDTIEYATVYAPTDAAFGHLPSGILDALLADVDALTAVLTYHVTTDPEWKADPRRGSNTAPTMVSTLQGQKLFAGWRNNHPMVNQSMANCTAVSTDNGIVWIIDSVLMPQF